MQRARRRSTRGGSRSRPAPTTCSATPRSRARSRRSASRPASTCQNRVIFKQLLAGRRDRLLPDRRLPPRRRQRGAGGAADGREVRRAGLPARRRRRPVRVRAAPVDLRLHLRSARRSRTGSSSTSTTCTSTSSTRCVIAQRPLHAADAARLQHHDAARNHLMEFRVGTRAVRS